MKKLVEQIHPDRLLNTGEEGLVQDLAEELKLDVPVLDETNIHTADFGETQIDYQPRSYAPDFRPEPAVLCQRRPGDGCYSVLREWGVLPRSSASPSGGRYRGGLDQ